MSGEGGGVREERMGGKRGGKGKGDEQKGGEGDRGAQALAQQKSIYK